MTAAEFSNMRASKGYTQKSFAEKVGYSRTQIGNFERGEYPIPKIVKLVLTLL